MNMKPTGSSSGLGSGGTYPDCRCNCHKTDWQIYSNNLVLNLRLSSIAYTSSFLCVIGLTLTFLLLTHTHSLFLHVLFVIRTYSTLFCDWKRVRLI